MTVLAESANLKRCSPEEHFFGIAPTPHSTFLSHAVKGKSPSRISTTSANIYITRVHNRDPTTPHSDSGSEAMTFLLRMGERMADHISCTLHQAERSFKPCPTAPSVLHRLPSCSKNPKLCLLSNRSSHRNGSSFCVYLQGGSM
jgi:hypothetical protein